MIVFVIRPKKITIKLFEKINDKRLKAKIETMSITHLP